MIFCWNVRGLNGQNKQKAVSRWILANRPLIGGFLETRVREVNILSVMTKVLPGWNYDSNHSEITVNGRIVVVWSPVVSLVTYVRMDQLLFCGVFHPGSNLSFTVGFLYGRNLGGQRRSL